MTTCSAAKSYKRRLVGRIFITLVIAMDPTPPRKPYGRGIMAYRSCPKSPQQEQEEVWLEPNLADSPDVIGLPCSPPGYRRPTPEWLREMNDRDDLSSYDEGDCGEDWSDEEPNEARAQRPQPPPAQQPPPPPAQLSALQPLVQSPSRSSTPGDEKMVTDAGPVTSPTTRPTSLLSPPPPLRPTTPPQPRPVVAPQKPANLFFLPMAPPATCRPQAANSVWESTQTLQLCSGNTISGQREVIRQQVEAIRQARSELADLDQQVGIARQARQENRRRRNAIAAIIACYDKMRTRRRMTEAKQKEERAAEKDFKDAVLNLYAILRRDDV